MHWAAVCSKLYSPKHFRPVNVCRFLLANSFLLHFLHFAKHTTSALVLLLLCQWLHFSNNSSRSDSVKRSVKFVFKYEIMIEAFIRIMSITERKLLSQLSSKTKLSKMVFYLVVFINIYRFVWADPNFEPIKVCKWNSCEWWKLLQRFIWVKCLNHWQIE